MQHIGIQRSNQEAPCIAFTPSYPELTGQNRSSPHNNIISGIPVQAFRYSKSEIQCHVTTKNEVVIKTASPNSYNNFLDVIFVDIPSVPSVGACYPLL